MTTMATPITEQARGSASSPVGPAVRRLDDLLALEHAELAKLYATAAVPRIEGIHGDLRGRMLAIPALPERATALPRAWARTASFPWRGKSFWPVAEGKGEGKNRVVKDRWKLFRFTTAVGPSLDDGRDAVRLDYDHADNPFFIRAIEDEIRELREGLYLGQAWLRVRGRATFVLWFGLESR
jgi:hypothetical protein